jgi:hypothetical protein
MTTHAISRFPVPDLAALPADLQKLFHDVSKKVCAFIMKRRVSAADKLNKLSPFWPISIVKTSPASYGWRASMPVLANLHLR